jgi:hypothetical protein
MKLSSYIQYYLRQVLCRYAHFLNYPMSGVGLWPYLQTDINQHLQQLYPNDIDLHSKVRELEKLVELHRKVDATAFCAPQNLSQIEQRVLWLLGLKFLGLLPMLSLSVVPEPSTTFRFLLNDSIYEGVHHANCLYGHAFEFGTEYNLQACYFLFTLRSKQIPFLFTVSKARHGIWLDLRSSAYHEIVQPSQRIIQKVA